MQETVSTWRPGDRQRAVGPLLGTVLLTGLAGLPLCPAPAAAEDVQEISADLQVAITLKVVPLAKSKNLAPEALKIYVAGSDAVAEKFQAVIGKEVGKVRVAEVKKGSGPPASPPHVIYIGGKQDLAEILAYAKREGILTVTGSPELIKDGPAIGIGGVGGKPKIFLNLEASKDEGIQWESAIFKIATTVK